MEIIETQLGGMAAVDLKGRIDSTAAGLLQERLIALVRSGCSGLIVDFKLVPYISSAGFKALLIAAKQGEASDCTLALCGIVGEVRRMFEIAAFDQVFTILATREECIEQIAAGSGGKVGQ
jgi:anti-anti-sigma factor